MAKAAPRLAYRVENTLTGEKDSQLNVELNFKNIDDFEPARVAEQIPALKELVAVRKELTQLLSKMEGNDKLESMLADLLNNTQQAMALAKELGVDAKGEGK
jgi:type VI secretion system protein ImpB